MPEEITEVTETEETTESVDVNDTESTESDAGESALGDAGKKALDSMKSKWRTERDQRRALEARISELEKPADTETPDLDAVRAEAAREATAKANARILRSEIKAAATGKLTNPAIALKLIDLDSIEVDANGDVDADEINEAIEDLLTREPYLAAKASRFQGTVDGGARKASGPSQLTRADLAGMSPAEIVQAKTDGRLKNLMSGE